MHFCPHPENTGQPENKWNFGAERNSRESSFKHGCNNWTEAEIGSVSVERGYQGRVFSTNVEQAVFLLISKINKLFIIIYDSSFQLS